MRPDVLNPLFAPITTLKRAGPRTAAAAARLFARPHREHARLLDLLLHLPSGAIDRGCMPSLNALPPESGAVITIRARVQRHDPPAPHSRAPWRVRVCDESGACLDLVYFHARGDWLANLLPIGEERYISGKLEWYGGRPQMPHPDHVLTADEFAAMPRFEPIYPATAGLTSRAIGNLTRQALDRLPDLPEWHDENIVRQRHWPSFSAALRTVHAPRDAGDIAPDSPARARLACDELLASQLALALMRRRLRDMTGRPLVASGHLRRAITTALPYALTNSQQRALEEILSDMAAPRRMLRLLQGDVGAGKTIVALLAMTAAVESGAQAALMVPSDLLARQHLASMQPLARAAGIELALLTAREKGETRRELLERIASGQAHVVIGTHALFQEQVRFADLGLVVVDEQHRFGVHQRLALQEKAARRADVLVMSATPIPRTLALALYGDMEISRLTEKPPGRHPVHTAVMPLQRLDEVVERLRAALARGERAYWVCPAVEENDALPATSAEERFAALSRRLGAVVGLVHGRMKGEARDAVMERFRAGEISVLVATTVVEVGVDVPQATIMIIENAERFGLAQLHQLRGRVGRSNRPSACLLLYREPLSATARERLRVMRETDDGFRLAEEDLRLRGAGELLGTRQAGTVRFRAADLAVHGDLLALARDEARMILSRDAALASPRGQALRHLLHIFERDAAIALLDAG